MRQRIGIPKNNGKTLQPAAPAQAPARPPAAGIPRHPAAVLALSRTAGNQAVVRRLRAGTAKPAVLPTPVDTVQAECAGCAAGAMPCPACEEEDAKTPGRPAAALQRTADAAFRLQRDALDPRNTAHWEVLSSPGMRRNFYERFYEPTLAAATGAALEVESAIGQAGVPADDAQRERFKQRARTLVRLNALGLMAFHRATILGQYDRVRAALQGGKPQGMGRQDTLRNIRENAAHLHRLLDDRERLRTDHRKLEVIAGRALISSSSESNLDDWYGGILEHTTYLRSAAIEHYLYDQAERITVQQASAVQQRVLVHFMVGCHPATAGSAPPRESGSSAGRPITTRCCSR